MSLPPDDYGIVFNYHVFTLESRIFLYSVDFEVEVEMVGEEGEEETIVESCIVGFLGEDYELVAHTNVHRYDFCTSCVCIIERESVVTLCDSCSSYEPCGVAIMIPHVESSYPLNDPTDLMAHAVVQTRSPY